VIRSRPGYWLANETAGDSVIACAPPATARCAGWHEVFGLTQCGAGYRRGTYLCGACANGHYASDDGFCAACPSTLGAWDRYAALLTLLGVALAAAVCTVPVQALVKRVYGGTLRGGMRHALGLFLWAVLVMQPLAQVTAITSPAMHPALIALFRALQPLQLAGVALASACTAEHAFQLEVRVSRTLAK